MLLLNAEIWQFAMWIWMLSPKVDGARCSDWRLEGGAHNNEGLVQLLYDNETVSVCADRFTEEHAYFVCDQLITRGGPAAQHIIIFNSSVYMSPPQRRTISYTDTSAVSTCGGNVATGNCSVVAGVCCVHLDVGNCSANWTSIFVRWNSSKLFNPQTLLTYNDVHGVTFTDNVPKSWTASSLKEQSACNGSIPTVSYKLLRNCSNGCLKNKMNVVTVGLNGTCRCLNETEAADCSSRTLTVVDRSGTFCIAAEVSNGEARASAEDCNRYFPAFAVSNSMLPTTPTTTVDKRDRYSIPSQSTTKTDGTKRDRSSLSTQTTSHRESFGSYKMWLIIGVSLLAIICMLLTILAIVLCKYKKNRRKGEVQRPNSVANETYTPDGFQQLREDEDEEYALITEMDCDCIAMSQYRPSVPERGTTASCHGLTHGRKYADDVEILTLDEYSKPSDSIPDTYMSSQSAEYTTTYDDPIRHTLNNEIGDNRRNDNEGNITRETCVPQSNNRDSKTKSKVLERNSRNSQSSALCRHSSVSDTKTDIIINDKTIDKHKTDEDEALDLELDKVRDKWDGCNTLVLERKYNEQTDRNCENFKAPDSNISKEALDDSDYEDTNILDGKYPTKCSSKRIFEEHVCLDCLKPEHLTKLGIKIIQDDNVYETRIPLQQRLSEPVDQTYNVDNFRFDPRQDKTDVIHGDVQCESTSARTNNDAEETIARQILNDKCVRKCSVCNTVYDRLGDVKPNIWRKCTDNVYDQFGNFEQFKVRRMLARKRKNSL